MGRGAGYGCDWEVEFGEVIPVYSSAWIKD